MARKSAFCLTAPLLLLSACQGEEKAPSAATAGGQVLPASVSDAMLPLDTVRSQPPLAPRPSAAGEDGADDGGDGEKPEAPASASPAAQPPSPAPAATPSAE